MTRRDQAVWAALVGVPVVWEFRQLARGQHGVPLSAVIRVVCRTDTVAGAVAFAVAVDLGASWLTRHILKGGGVV